MYNFMYNKITLCFLLRERNIEIIFSNKLQLAAIFTKKIKHLNLSDWISNSYFSRFMVHLLSPLECTFRAMRKMSDATHRNNQRLKSSRSRLLSLSNSWLLCLQSIHNTVFYMKGCCWR